MNQNRNKTGTLQTIIRSIGLRPKQHVEELPCEIMDTLLHALEDIDEELDAHFQTHKNTKNESLRK